MDAGGVISLILLVVFLVGLAMRLIVGSWWRLPVGGALTGWLPTFRRMSSTRAVVHHLSTITHLNLPLAQALTTAGRTEPGRVGVVLQRMGQAVAEGLPLATAMRRADPRCPLLVTSVMDAGERAGQLPQALADLEDALGDELRAKSDEAMAGGQYWVYPACLMAIVGALLYFVMVFVMPKFQEIFMDFDTRLPPMTINLIDLSTWCVRADTVAVLLLGILVVTVVTVAAARRAPGYTVRQTIMDTCGWIPWLTKPVSFGKGMSTALRVVRMGTAAGMTLPAASALAASVRVNRHLRRRWDGFVKMIEGGIPASRAAGETGLGGVFARACRDLERGNADPQLVLGHAADYYRACAFRWWRALWRITVPAATCAMGCVVGYIVLALFLPLLNLIYSSAGAML